ncbi:MAG: hypothetical protein L3K14_09300 [Thermoplasmata archaeon]|nr:hypothetical protein [Thermoplasmata archaeon]
MERLEVSRALAGAGSGTPKVGDRRSTEQTFAVEEVRAFGEASGDKGLRHVVPDAQGRLMVHGLLLGTLPTKIGGELNFLAREMALEFLRPVLTGDTIPCDVVLRRWKAPAERRTLVTAHRECTNQDRVVVMRGRADGLVRDPRLPE